MKIGMVGLGYWGKIILKNLRELGYKNITICEINPINWNDIGEKYKVVTDYKKLKCDYVFVLTPATQHYEICKYFLSNHINVFCEKPLDTNINKCKELFDLANKNHVELFVDWLFLFNPAVHMLKQLISDFGKPRNIITNRMNFGPIRYDINARWDLASHDVSIINYLIDDKPLKVQWIDFSRNINMIPEDSAIGILSYESTNVQINVSWHYGIKDRLYTLDFDDAIITWDDNTKKIIHNNEIVIYENYSPLHNAIQSFFNNNFKNIEKHTLDITRILSNENII